MEIAILAERLGLDVEDILELLELYIENVASDLSELDTALKAGDAAEAHKRSHSIKGASGNLGLNDLYEIACKIDNKARLNEIQGLDLMVQNFKEKYDGLVDEFKNIA